MGRTRTSLLRGSPSTIDPCVFAYARPEPRTFRSRAVTSVCSSEVKCRAKCADLRYAGSDTPLARPMQFQGFAMDVKVFNKAELTMALGAVRTLEPNPTPDQDRLITAVARLHGVDLFPPLLPRPAHSYLARALRDHRQKKRVVELGVAFTMTDGELRPVSGRNLDHLALTLGHAEEVETYRERAAHQYLLARVDFTRRMAARMYGNAWPTDAERGLRTTLAGLLRARDEVDVAARYHALGNLSPLSFGYALWNHYRQNRFRFPGEGGGVPERLLLHDLSHVLSGYPTDPMGELQQSAFQTGCARDDSFLALYLGILSYQLGVRVAPERHEPGEDFDTTPVCAALARGISCRVDLGTDWDFWPLLPQALSDVRRHLGVPPMSRFPSDRCPPALA